MANYKISVSKDGKKYNIVFKAENESAARERVHKEGYSILSLQEIFDKNEIGNTFIFEGFKGEEYKHGKIVGNDIFKSYVKLRKDLEYDVKYIYSEEDNILNIDQKNKIIEELREEYNLYYNSGKKDKIDELKEKIKNEKSNNVKTRSNNIDNFYLKKELDDVNFLLEKVIFKLEEMISSNLIQIDSGKKEKLKIIYNEIIKLKKSTNISKLREIGELALLKIGKIELEEVEKNKNKENRELLKETNKLLKKIGSKDQFIEKDKDFQYQIKLITNKIKEFFESVKKVKKEGGVDKESHSYIKNLLYLSKYKDLYRENTKLILKNFLKLIYNKELKDDLFLSRSVIKQNIILLKAKEKGLSISYTYIKKGFGKIVENILLFFQGINKLIFVVIVFYSISFILYINLNSFLSINNYGFNGIFYFIIFLLIYIIISISKNIIILITNFVFLFFIIIFGVINF
ncbi:MAG: hypothetical protein PHV23_03945 [Candidatus Gracilibacteria bacterium]|nr:hypothetical protein [Candidatus Gracilibacteria bacterium]